MGKSLVSCVVDSRCRAGGLFRLFQAFTKHACSLRLVNPAH